MGKRFHYTYRVKFPYQGWWYWGMHSTDDLNDGYCGSPRTHKEKWNWFEWEMEILEFFGTREEAWKVEYRLIAGDLDNVLCLNEGNGRVLSFESKRKSEKTQRERKVGVWDPEIQRRRIEGVIRNQAGLFDPKIRDKGRKIANEICRKPCKVTHLETGEVFFFDSAVEASGTLGVNNGNLCQTAYGKRPHAGGYRMEFTFR
jgi:hypothetical protein